MPRVRRCTLTALLSLALVGGAASALAQTTTTSTSSTTTTSLVPVSFADPSFFVKRIWSGASRSIPGDLGGLFFSQDGGTLYVVGNLTTPTNRLYALGVVRDAGTGEVTNLTGPGVEAFTGSAIGLDSGFAFGPSGTLFYGYYPANQLLQRPGGVGGVESSTAMSGSIATGTGGVTFNPMRPDVQTGFGKLLVNNGNSTMYEVPLSPLGGGLYQTGTLAQYVRGKASIGGMGKMLFLPAPYEGQLLYAAFGDGQLRLIQIDVASGLPINQTSGLPALGTTNPIDTVFADGFGSDIDAGPLGLALDPVTNDLFTTTSQGTPANTIFQVKGFLAAGIGTTTTTTILTTSTISTTSTVSTSSTTTTSTPPTTSTTLPSCSGVAPLCGGTCPPGQVCDGDPLQPCACVSAVSTTSTTLASTTTSSSTTTNTAPTSTTSTTVPVTTSTVASSSTTSTSSTASTTVVSSSTTTSTSATSTSIPGSTTTSSTLPPSGEVCGNCLDDDGNGLTDFEDPACCDGAIAPLHVERLRVRSGVSTSRIKVVATGLPALPMLSPFVHGVFVQLAADSGEPLLCAALDPVRFKGRKTTASFGDRSGAVPEASGLSSIRLERLGTGALRLRLGGSRAAFTTPATTGALRFAVAFTDFARPDMPVRCAAGSVGVVPAKRGGLTLP